MQEPATSSRPQLILSSMSKGVDSSIVLLKYMGYQTERTEWDFSDLAPKARQRVDSMFLISSYQIGFDSFQVFHIELHQSRDEQALKTARLLPILDTFLRRYAQGQYLFIFSAGNSHRILFHLRKTEWRGDVLLMRFVSRDMDVSHLHKVDHWLIENLHLTTKEQSPAQIWAKHHSVFGELHQKRKQQLRQRKLRHPLLEAYYNEIYCYRNPSQAFKDKLIERLRRGDESVKQDIIHAHLWLVVHEAKKYQNLGLDLIDLIQEGNLGLIRAIQDFDPDLGTQFSTYATYWVRQKITRALADKSLLIRIPVHAYDNQFIKSAVIEKKLTKTFGFRPPIKAIALEVGNFTHEEQCEAWCCWIYNIPMELEFEQRFEKTWQKLQKIVNASQGILSLQEPIADFFTDVETTDVNDAEQELTLGDLIYNAWNIETKADDTILSETIQNLLDQIHPREKKIINYRFGLNKCEESTLQEIADKMGVTRERIRQIENSALDRLHIFRNRTYIEGYLDSNLDLTDNRDQITGQTMGYFINKIPKGYELPLQFQKKNLMRRYAFADELKRWREMSYSELINEIRCIQDIEHLFSKKQTVFQEFVSSYTSFEYNYRVSNLNIFNEAILDMDFENDENEKTDDLLSELDK